MDSAVLLRADRIEREALVRVLERAAHYRLDLDKRLARLIISELADALRRGRR